MQLKKTGKDIWQITKKSTVAWYEADPFRQGAIISYYAIFSIPALLVIIIACAGLFFGKEAVSGHISSQISSIMGADTAVQLEKIIARSSEAKSTIFATIIGLVTLILGATGVFAQLQKSLDIIWEVEVKETKRMWLKTLKDRLFSFGLILSIGFLLLISLLLSTALTVFSDWITAYLPDFMLFLFRAISFVISFGVITVLFALMFKILPDVIIRWKDVWIGAMITAVLFIIGKFGLSLYFGKTSPASAYGAAGSIILIMLWVNYSSMIVFLGAEFTKQFASHYGREITPTKEAVRIIASEKQKEVETKNKAVDKIESEQKHT
ncbi:MAG: YihY/virulence factor BrkB family protein [Bacteroidia bacterium]